MKITLITNKLPDLLPGSADPIRSKIKPIPFLDNHQSQIRRKLTWAWSESLADRYVAHLPDTFIKDSMVSVVDIEIDTPIDFTLSWTNREKTSAYDMQFRENWKRLMSWCYISNQDTAILHVTHLGYPMPPSCVTHTRVFSGKELYDNWTKLTGLPSQDRGFKQGSKQFCTTDISSIPDLLPMQGRSEGFHVSTAVKSLSRDLGIIPKTNSGLSITWAQIGCAWEDAVIKHLQSTEPGKFEVLPELSFYGTFGTSDLFYIPNRVMIEIKAAWISSRQQPDGDKFFRYRCQLMSYCHMMGTSVGWIIVCHIMGDWKTLTPQYRVWQFDFTQGELQDNWALVEMKKREWESEQTKDRKGGEK